MHFTINNSFFFLYHTNEKAYIIYLPDPFIDNWAEKW